RQPPSARARGRRYGQGGWRSRPSCPHLVSADKNDEPNDVLLVVGLIRAQRDRNRARGVVQNDVAATRSLAGPGPAPPPPTFHLIAAGSRAFLCSCALVQLGKVRGIGRAP